MFDKYLINLTLVKGPSNNTDFELSLQCGNPRIKLHDNLLFSISYAN